MTWKGGKPLTRRSKEKLARMIESPEILAAWWSDILDRVADGETVYDLAAQEEITVGVLLRWIRESKARMDDLDLALNAYSDKLVAETIQIADGKMPIRTTIGGVVVDIAMDAANNKNRINARQWAASKHHREKYGEKVDINVAHTVDVRLAITEARDRVAARKVETIEQKSEED
jgi:hypothetical protein